MLTFVTSSRRLARLRNLFTFCEAGVHQRIDENRMLAEMLQRDASAFLATHPWVVQTLRSQDAFLCAIATELPPSGERIYALEDGRAARGPRALPALLSAGASRAARARRRWGVLRRRQSAGVDSIS